MKDVSHFLVKEASWPAGFPAPSEPGVIEVKSYPASRMAVAAGGDERGQFNRLFRHIKQQDIPMTAPVDMTYDRSWLEGEKMGRGQMGFYYPAADIGQLGTMDDVQVVDVPAMTAVSLGVKGSYSAKSFTKALVKLRQWLAEHKEYEAAGPPRVLAYNSPFVLWFRKYAEVQVPVRRTAVTSGAPAADGRR